MSIAGNDADDRQQIAESKKIQKGILTLIVVAVLVYVGIAVCQYFFKL